MRLASTRYSVGAWQSDVDALALDQLEALGRRRSARRRSSPRRRRATARGRRCAPTSTSRSPSCTRRARRGSAPSQCSAWARWPGQVALGVQRGARLAGGPRGEDDQRRVVGVEVGDLGRRLLRAVLVEDRVDLGHRHVGDPVRELAEQLLVADAERRVRDARRGARGRRGAAGCCTAARRRPCASRRAGSAPTRSGCRRASSRRRRGPTPRAANAPESPADIAISSPKCQTRRLAVARDREQRRLRRREALEQVLDQVHGDRSLPMPSLACGRPPVGCVADRARGAASEPITSATGAPVACGALGSFDRGPGARDGRGAERRDARRPRGRALDPDARPRADRWAGRGPARPGLDRGRRRGATAAASWEQAPRLRRLRARRQRPPAARPQLGLGPAPAVLDRRGRRDLLRLPDRPARRVGSPRPLSVDWDAWARDHRAALPARRPDAVRRDQAPGPYATIRRRLGRTRVERPAWPWAEIEPDLGLDEGADAWVEALRETLGAARLGSCSARSAADATRAS